MSRYRQLSIEERCSIARLHEDGQSIRQIATALDRQPSTIARELKRNAGAKVGYQPAYAQAQTDARRWSGRGWSVTMSCVKRCSIGLHRAGRPSRACPGAGRGAGA